MHWVHIVGYHIRFLTIYSLCNKARIFNLEHKALGRGFKDRLKGSLIGSEIVCKITSITIWIVGRTLSTRPNWIWILPLPLVLSLGDHGKLVRLSDCLLLVYDVYTLLQCKNHWINSSDFRIPLPVSTKN